MSRKRDWERAKRKKQQPERKSFLEVRADRYLEAAEARRAKRSSPTITQRETIASLNRSLGENHAVPATEREAAFLIEGLVSLERKRKRGRS